MMLGLGTVAVLAFFGMAFLKSQTPVIGYVILGAAALRMVLWLVEFFQIMRSSTEHEDPEREFFGE